MFSRRHKGICRLIGKRKPYRKIVLPGGTESLIGRVDKQRVIHDDLAGTPSTGPREAGVPLQRHTANSLFYF